MSETKKNITLVFKDYKDFVEYKIKHNLVINGVSKEFAEKNPNYKKDNASNICCWNCKNCINCSRCADCTDCKNCNKCIKCNNCAYCVKCTDCTDCSSCYICKYCKDCESCRYCYNADEIKNTEDGGLTYIYLYFKEIR